MEVISVKLDEHTLKDMELKIRKNHYTTRTDFIREAIRDKMKSLDTEEAKRNLMKHFGTAKTKTSYEEYRRNRETVGGELLKRFSLD